MRRFSLIQKTLMAAFITSLSAPVCAQDRASLSVEITTIEDQKAVQARVQSVDLRAARARIGGIVTRLLVDEGSDVEAGEEIARVIDEKLHLELQTLEAREASLQAERRLAEIALERAQKLRQSGAGSQVKLDEARTNLDVVVKNLRAMESERQLILQREKEGAIVSPAKGRVMTLRAAQGEVILPGEAVAEIADATFILRLEVPERHARFIKKGDQVTIGERGLRNEEGQSNTGTVRQVYPKIENGRVIADVDVTGFGDYFLGERVQVYVSSGQRDTVLIPKDYVFIRFGLAFVEFEDGRLQVVQPGQELGERIEILSGLRTGDRLVLPNKSS